MFKGQQIKFRRLIVAAGIGASIFGVLTFALLYYKFGLLIEIMVRASSMMFLQIIGGAAGPMGRFLGSVLGEYGFPALVNAALGGLLFSFIPETNLPAASNDDLASGQPLSSQDRNLSSIRHFLRLSPRVATSGQPEAGEFAAIAEAGFECVINLALPTSTYALPDEAAVVAAHGLEYVHIPVEWESPRFEDFVRFAEVMRARSERRVFVHCAMNMRVSAFMYLYRTLEEGVAPAEAGVALLRIWDPDLKWRRFMHDVSARWPA